MAVLWLFPHEDKKLALKINHCSFVLFFLVYAMSLFQTRAWLHRWNKISLAVNYFVSRFKVQQCTCKPLGCKDWHKSTLPTVGKAEWARPLHGAGPPDSLRATLGPGSLLLPDHWERLQANRGQDPPARVERGDGERVNGQAAALGLGQLFAPQGPAVSLQSCREHGGPAVLQREEGAPETTTTKTAAASATGAPQRWPGQTEAPAGPEEEPQPAQSPPGCLAPGAGSKTDRHVNRCPYPVANQAVYKSSCTVRPRPGRGRWEDLCTHEPWFHSRYKLKCPR